MLGIGVLERRPAQPPRTIEPVHALADVADVTVGEEHVCALRRDGAVFCWGTNIFGQLGQGTAGYLGALPGP
jgi:alpha-tubulin suppressor-like RCC1 family protein